MENKKINKFKLEWVITQHETKVGVIRNTTNMYGVNNDYIDCSISCHDCEHFINRNLMTPKSSDNDFCLNKEVISRFENGTKTKTSFECSPYLRSLL